MLSSQGNKQPPHSISAHSNLGEASSERLQEAEICWFCQNEVFTAELHHRLLSSQYQDQRSVSLKYSRLSQDFHSSVLARCRWCQSLMSGILTAAHLDYWYDHWNGSHSDGSSMDIERSDVEVEELENDRHVSDSESSSWKDDDRSSREWTLSLQDLEKYPGLVFVEINFIQGGSLDIYTIIEVALEVSWQSRETENGDLLPDLRGEKAVQLTFEAFSKLGAKQSTLFPLLPEAYNLASDQCFQLAETWIEDCKKHEKCQSKPMEPQLASLPTGTDPVALSRIPRYLIDISHLSGPRVVTHRSLPQEVKYVALSYVWGMNQTYVLTKATLEEKLSSLDLSQIPKTIIDAIEVTRRLGHKYLWVDALCIVQDAGEDVKDEIAVMGAIYRESAVTIIAANASSSSEGFLRATESPNWFVDPFDIPFSTKHGTVKYLSVGYRSYYKPFKDPINSRAWTLQERILSSRNLVYSYDGPKWSCQTCERNPSGPPDAPLVFPRVLSYGIFGESKGTAFKDGLREAWLDIRTEYTSRKLTYGQDKLAAISAIALEIYRETGWTYLAGLWKEHLFLDLQWHRDPQSTMSRPGKDEPTNPLYLRSTEYRAPSWSWASMDGRVVDPNEGGDPRYEFHFRILSCDVDYRNAVTPAEFHFEPVRRGILVVEARVIELDWRWADPEELTDVFLLDPMQGISYICGEASFDAQEPDLEPKGTKVCCLAMSVLNYENRKRLPVEGLLILREKEPEMFRRIGFFKIYSTTMFNGVSERTVRII